MDILKITKLFLLCLIICCFTSCNEKNSPNPKIWLHRSNEIAKAQYFENKFAGFELDVHFIDSLNMFIIKHDSDEASNITLDEWFSALKEPKNLGFWLDFKNLDDNNKVKAVKALKDLRKKYNLKGKIYVESMNPNSLQVFKDEQFKTSFYIPCDNPAKLDSVGLVKLEAKIQKVIDNNNVSAISGYYFQYEFMRDKFPDMNKLLWYHEFNTEMRQNYIDIANDDDKIEVLLVTEKMPCFWWLKRFKIIN